MNCEEGTEHNIKEYNCDMDVNIKTEMVVKVEPEDPFIFCMICRESFSTDTEYMNHENDLFGCHKQNENQKMICPEINPITDIPLTEIKVETNVSIEFTGNGCFQQQDNFTTAGGEDMTQDVKPSIIGHSTGIGEDPTYSAASNSEIPIKVEVSAEDLAKVKKENDPTEQIPAKETKVKQRLPCQLCSNTFSVAKTLKNHVAVVHNNERPFQCQVCLKSFGRKALLKIHENIHSGARKFECKVCLKTFAKNSVLKVHEEIHRKQFQCQHCPETFPLKTHLVKHERLHGHIAPYQCEICSKRFIRKVSLKEHFRSHSGEKPFHCKVCFKCFSRTTHRKRHEMIHTGEKPFQCKVCSKRFLRRIHLVEHERIHTGEKPIKCKFCDKCFTQNSHRYKHEKCHKGEIVKEWDEIEDEEKELNHPMSDSEVTDD